MSLGKLRVNLHLTRLRAIRIHRWVGLLACAFWFIQAATGLLSVFHWELEDLSISSLRTATDLPAIQARLEELVPANSRRRISMIWTSAGLPDRYDVWVEDEAGGPASKFRIAGDGTVLRMKTAGTQNFFDYVVELHQSLLAGKRGRWIVGLGGVLLISNLLLGLRAAWPTRRRWRAALLPRRTASAHGRLYSLHRALGLMAALPALILFAAGTSLAYKDSLSAMIGAQAPSMVPQPSSRDRSRIGFAAAVEAAFAAAHTRRLTAVEMPTDEDATYRIRVLGPGELRRAIGTTRVFVDANTGAVRGISTAASQGVPQRFINGLYTIHTGEMAGLAGRLVVLAVGTWLLTMIVLGLRMWRGRVRHLSTTRSEPTDGQLDSAAEPFLQSPGPSR